MGEVDLSKLPSGRRGWAALIEWAAASGDSEERYFLELKSALDLSAKEAQHKVAKFILGAANRDPAKAAKRFGGHAVMLIGVGDGKTTGIEKFEAQNLFREVQKFIGADGPGWDYEQIPTEDGRVVIAIIVDPPTGEIRASLHEGIGLKNGDVYLRKDGNTEKASGYELMAMLKRMTALSTASTLPPIDVAFHGDVHAIRYDRGVLVKLIDSIADEHLGAVPSTQSRFAALAGTAERRSVKEFTAQVTKWRESAKVDPETGLEELAAAVAVGVRLQLVNPEKRSLRDVKVVIQFDPPVRALEWTDPDDGYDLFPDQPLEWGKDSIVNLLPVIPSFNRSLVKGDLEIMQTSPAQLSLTLDLLRAKETAVSPADEVVLVAFVEAEFFGPVSYQWSLTASDVDDVLEGQGQMEVRFGDWVQPLTRILNGDRLDDDSSDDATYDSQSQ